MDRENETTTSKAQEISPLESTINRNDELLSAIEKQLEVLESRLIVVSSNTPDESGEDATTSCGISTTVSLLGSHGHRLSKISNTISRLTRNLEI